MVKDRKPMFVSGEALKVLKEIANEKKCFAGDVVDMLLKIRTMEQIDEQFKTNILKSKQVGRLPKLGRKHGKRHAGSGEAQPGHEVREGEVRDGQGDGPAVPSEHQGDTLNDTGNNDGEGLRFVLS